MLALSDAVSRARHNLPIPVRRCIRYLMGETVDWLDDRRRLARRYLRGDGIEIGALHRPTQLPRGASVRYVDRLDADGLRRHYPELDPLPIVGVDVVDDGETLSSFDSRSLDFVVANHFIEHTEDPIGTLEQHLRVVREGGILYLAVPDKRTTFDLDRPRVTLEHLTKDHEEGPARSRYAHFEEWVRLVTSVPPGEQEREVRRLMEMDYSIHFHCWTPHEFLELLVYCRSRFGLPLNVEALLSNEHEFVVVVRRTPQPKAPPL